MIPAGRKGAGVAGGAGDPEARVRLPLAAPLFSIRRSSQAEEGQHRTGFASHWRRPRCGNGQAHGGGGQAEARRAPGEARGASPTPTAGSQGGQRANDSGPRAAEADGVPHVDGPPLLLGRDASAGPVCARRLASAAPAGRLSMRLRGLREGLGEFRLDMLHALAILRFSLRVRYFRRKQAGLGRGDSEPTRSTTAGASGGAVTAGGGAVSARPRAGCAAGRLLVRAGLGPRRAPSHPPRGTTRAGRRGPE